MQYGTVQHSTISREQYPHKEEGNGKESPLGHGSNLVGTHVHLRPPLSATVR